MWLTPTADQCANTQLSSLATATAVSQLSLGSNTYVSGQVEAAAAALSASLGFIGQSDIRVGTQLLQAFSDQMQLRNMWLQPPSNVSVLATATAAAIASLIPSSASALLNASNDVGDTLSHNFFLSAAQLLCAEQGAFNLAGAGVAADLQTVLSSALSKLASAMRTAGKASFLFAPTASALSTPSVPSLFVSIGAMNSTDSVFVEINRTATRASRVEGSLSNYGVPASFSVMRQYALMSTSAVKATVFPMSAQVALSYVSTTGLAAVSFDLTLSGPMFTHTRKVISDLLGVDQSDIQSINADFVGAVSSAILVTYYNSGDPLVLQVKSLPMTLSCGQWMSDTQTWTPNVCTLQRASNTRIQCVCMGSGTFAAVGLFRSDGSSASTSGSKGGVKFTAILSLCAVFAVIVLLGSAFAHKMFLSRWAVLNFSFALLG